MDIYGVGVSKDLSFHIVTRINDLLFKKGLVTEKASIGILVFHRELVNSEVPLKSGFNCKQFTFMYLT